MEKTLATIALILISFSGATSEANSSRPRPLTNVDMTLDLDGMEKYAQEASESRGDITIAASHRQQPQPQR